MNKLYKYILLVLFLTNTGLYAQSPGGVATNLQLWLKADVGVITTGTKVTQWNDQSVNVRNHTQAVIANQPSYINIADAKMFNHQPTVRFATGALQWLESANYSAALNTALYVFTVSRVIDNPSTTWRSTYGFSGDLLHTSWFGDNPSVYRFGNILAAPKTNTYHAISSVILPSGTLAADATPRVIWNGSQTTGTKGTNTIGNNTFSVGRDRNGTDYMDGDIAEVIIYKGTSLNADINAADLVKIQSYLSVKYGISLDPNATTGQANYVSSNGTTFWTGTSNTGYQNNIFGLGLDSGSALNQKQATSYPDESLTLFQGALQVLNRDNTTVIPTNNSFLMLGDNNLNGKTVYAQPIGTTFQNATTTALINNRSNRIWKAQTTTIGTWTTNIKLNSFSQGTYVMISNGSTFLPASTRIYPVINGVASNVSISNGEFVSVATNYKAPAGIATGLQHWYDGNYDLQGLPAGVTGWKDRWNDFKLNQAGTSTAGTVTSSADARSNFNTFVEFPNNAHFSAAINPLALGKLHTTFAVAERTAVFNPTYNHAFRFGTLPSSGTTHRYALGINNAAGNASLHYINNGGEVERISTQAFGDGVPGLIGGRINAANGALNRDVSFNGKSLSFTDIIGLDVEPNMQIGGSVFGLNGRIPEVIYYNTPLSNVDRQKVDSYLAIKYGLTLLQPLNYLASNGSVAWSSSANTAYNNNIFGVATDGALEQKISNSINVGKTLKVAVNNDFISLNTATSRSKVADGTYQMFGDNNAAAGQVALGITCPALPAGLFRLNREWLTQTTGTPGAMWLEVDMAGTTMNAEINLLIGDDAALSINTQTVAGTLVGGKAIFNTTFSGTKYFTVVGKVVASPCASCVGGTFKVNAGNAWNPLAGRNLNNNGTYAVGTDAVGNAITANNTITYATPSNEYVPQYYPAPYGAGAIMGRYDTTNGAAGKSTYTTTLSHAAQVDFKINGISTYYGNKVKVVIKGECNGLEIFPKITPVVTGYLAAYNSYKITGNEVLGDKYYMGLLDYGAVRIVFDQPVSKVTVEWTIERSPTYITGYWLWIQDFSLKCQTPAPPVVDNVSVEQMFDNKEKPACGNAEMKVTINNANCSSKVVTDFTNVLPAGIEYVADSFSSSDITSVSPTYSGANFSLPSFTVESGKSVFYIKVKSTNALAPTTAYPTQSSYKIAGSISPDFVQSDNADGVTGFQSTPITFTASTPLPVPLIALVSDVPVGSCGRVRYVATINNNTGSTLTNYGFQTKLNPGQTLVASSLQISGGATGATQPSTYAGEGNFLLTGMNIPTGIHNVVFETNSLIAVDNPLNEVTISADPSNECALASSKTASLPLKTCVACVGGKGKLQSAVSWLNGGAAARTSNSLSNVAVGAPSSGALKADVTVTYPNATTEWIPSAFPRMYGKWTEISRYDNLNGATGTVKYIVNLKDVNGATVAAKPSFQVAGMTKFYAHTDIVTIKGFCGANEVKPILKFDNKFQPALYNRYTIADNVATGAKPYYDDWTYATANVEFESSVERVEIEWNVNRTSTSKSLSFLYVSDINLQCDNPVEPTADNVSLVTSYISDDLPTCNEGTLKLNFKNYSCVPQTVNVTNALPNNLQYVSNSYAGLNAESPTYSAQAFFVVGLQIPVGNSYVYVKVKPTNIANSGTYATVFNYSVVGGTNPSPYRSDDDSGFTGYQDTKVTYTAAPVVVKPTLITSVDKCFKPSATGSGTELTYTITINNPSGNILSNVSFTDVLDGDQKYVASSLVNGFGGTANDYAIEDKIMYIKGMTIPANTINGVITFKATSQSTVSDIKNVATLTVDPESACGSSNRAYSNELDVIRCLFCTQSPNTNPATEFATVGISTMTKRAGWPASIPNGFLVMESNDKGFVITRLSTIDRNSPTFVAIKGMLIYNTTENCVQLYNGIAWKCIERDCNN